MQVDLSVSRQRDPICAFCGHGRQIHDGPETIERQHGWCRACDERRRDGSRLPMCYWFTDASYSIPPPRRPT
jgi:hypothetical protein